MENTDLSENHLLYEEEEKDFENVIPEFGTCGGGEVDISKIGKKEEQQPKTCCSKNSLTASST
jgi:predicted AlkP superfamily phosphohydrolase/phosphomutase